MLLGICIVVSHFQSPAEVFPVIWVGTCGFTFHSTFQLTFAIGIAIAIAFVVNFMAFSFAGKRFRCSFSFHRQLPGILSSKVPSPPLFFIHPAQTHFAPLGLKIKPHKSEDLLASAQIEMKSRVSRPTSWNSSDSKPECLSLLFKKRMWLLSRTVLK